MVLGSFAAPWRAASVVAGKGGGCGSESGARPMKKTITGLDEAGQAMKAYLSSAGAKALSLDEPWTYVPSRKGLRRQPQVIFPHPKDIDVADDAKRWADLADDVAADTKADFTVSLLILALLLSLMLLPLNLTLSALLGGVVDPVRQVGALGLAVAIAAAALLFMIFFARGMRQGPAWERRAAALRLRAQELAAAQAGPSEQAAEAASRRRSCWRG